jgi:predicted Zn-dependent protease with MMP-like domain
VASDHLDPAERFEEYAQDAVDSLPSDLRGNMSNLEIVVEDEPPPGSRCSVSTRAYRSPDAAARTVARSPTRSPSTAAPSRVSTGATTTCFAEVRRVVLHEIAHHFGISDERLIEIDRY